MQNAMRPVIKFGLSELTHNCTLENIIYEFQVVLSTGVKIFGVLWNCHERDNTGYGILGYALFLERNEDVPNPVIELLMIGENENNSGFRTSRAYPNFKKGHYNSRRLLRDIFEIKYLSDAFFRLSEKENYEYHQAIDLYGAGFRVKNMTVIHRHNFCPEKYYMMNVVMYVDEHAPRNIMKDGKIRPTYFGKDVVPIGEGDLAGSFSNLHHKFHSYKQFLKDSEIPDLHHAIVRYENTLHEAKKNARR